MLCGFELFFDSPAIDAASGPGCPAVDVLGKRRPRDGNGDGVAVCLVDSGVERSVLEARCRARGQDIFPIEGGIFSADRAEPLPYEGHQSTPHGTTVADIVLTVAPRVHLFSADVFGPRGSCEVEVVLRALRWAVDVWKCKVINLSLGVAEQRLQQAQRRLQLQRVVEEAYYKDVLVVAAAHNDHPLTRSYPAAFAPPLLSVDKGLFGDPLVQAALRMFEWGARRIPLYPDRKEEGERHVRLTNEIVADALVLHDDRPKEYAARSSCSRSPTRRTSGSRPARCS